MNTLTPISPQGLVYNHIVSTGGIGSGIFFSMEGNDTLGRNESRMATLLPYKDFCKQHIIMHYVSVLLGAKRGGEFQCYPIGKVGNDDVGRSLLKMMNNAGMDIANVRITDKCSTLFSVCYQYPDHSGGNITTNESASSLVSAGDISSFFINCKLSGEKEIILAVPEVPVETRIKLLEYGRLRGSLNVASVLSSEIKKFKELNGFGLTDILSVNLDEAQKVAGIADDSASDENIVEACIKNLKSINPAITILITCGSKGVYCYSKNVIEFTPALKVPVVSTAGAGDAFLSGFLSGVCCGLPLLKGINDNYFSESPVSSAVELGILLASLCVMSQDTINADANAESLYNFIAENNIGVGDNVLKMADNCLKSNNHSKISN
jgi:sugar/nucleoside kinase (ribokinase family)